MKKLLIVGSCGALVILILGATNARLNAQSAQPKEIPVLKCIENTESQATEAGCVEKGSKLRGELFLRPLKKKERRVFA